MAIDFLMTQLQLSKMTGYAGITIYGDDLDFAALTRVIGFKPDRLSRKGDLRAGVRSVSTDMWSYDSRQKRRRAAPNKPLDYLLRKLLAKRDAVGILKYHAQWGIQRITIGVLLDLSGSHGTFQVAGRHIQLAAALGAGLWFDVWRTKPRPLQNYTDVDWDCVKSGSNVEVCVETDFCNCDVFFTPEQVKKMADCGVSPTIRVW
jgi:Domain of unknown function (DUF4279)